LDSAGSQAFAVFLASYAKRWLEGNFYDRAFSSDTGRKLIALEDKYKYGIEFCLYALTAFFEGKLAEDTVLKKLVKEIGIDAPPEIGKRMINGAKNRIRGHAETADEKASVETLLELDDELLFVILKWLYEHDGADRQKILRYICSLNRDELAELAAADKDQRERLVDIATGTDEDTLAVGLSDVASQLRDFRVKRREKRNKSRRR
jgi:hypothetical protein